MEVAYLLDGEEVHVVERLKDGVIVRRTFDIEDGTYVGDQEIVKEVFSSAPTARWDKQIEALEIASNLLVEKNSQLLTEQLEITERLKRLKKFDQLKRLEDFIDGKITHYVTEQYGSVRLLPLSDATCDSDRGCYRNSELKLLTLFGCTASRDRDLSWRLNRYSDGSGSSIDVYPCCGEEEAKEVAAKIVAQLFANWKIGKSYYLSSVIESALLLGLPVPPEAAEKHAKDQRDAAEKNIADLRKRLADAEAKLSEIAETANAN